MPKIAIKNLYKVFGQSPHKAMSLLKSGKTKEEIYEATSLTVGVQDASFEVEKGEIFVVMGLSGSGKSTLVRMLNRLIEPTSGEVLVDGEDILKIDKQQLVKIRRSKTSMVFQSFALMPHLCVLDNVAFGLELDGIDKKTRKTRALDALKHVGLDAWESAMPNELSGGMQTTPAYVYLVPIVMLFSIGNVAGVLATIVFSLPPVTRLTALGIRQVHPELVEAALAFGATGTQVLLKVQVLLAMLTIMAGLNQTIMMTLSMVVIAALIGAGGLGAPVVLGLNTLDIGLATIGGLSIVLIAIVLDRIIQALGSTEK